LARGIALEVYAQRLLREAIASRAKGHTRASQDLIDSLFFPDPPNSAAKADTNIDRHL